jgi:hypothetical protein
MIFDARELKNKVRDKYPYEKFGVNSISVILLGPETNLELGFETDVQLQGFSDLTFDGIPIVKRLVGQIIAY